MRYADFCTKCGAKAAGRFCAKCGSEIYVMDDSTDNNNASLKEKYPSMKDYSGIWQKKLWTIIRR